MEYTFSWTDKVFCNDVMKNVDTTNTTKGRSTWLAPSILGCWAELWDNFGLKAEFKEYLRTHGFYQTVKDCDLVYAQWCTGEPVTLAPLFLKLLQFASDPYTYKTLATCLMFAKRVYMPSVLFDASKVALRDWKQRNKSEKFFNMHGDLFVEDRWLILPEPTGRYVGHSAVWAHDILARAAVYPTERVGHKHLCDSLRATAEAAMTRDDVQAIWDNVERALREHRISFPSGSTADCKRDLVKQVKKLYAAVGEDILHGVDASVTPGYLFDSRFSFSENFIRCIESSNPFVNILDVPKSGDKRRIIGPVSAVHNILCHLVQVALYDFQPHYRYVHFCLSDQSVNRDMAREGSIFGTFATVDLTAASDSISRKAMESTTPGYQHDLLIRIVPDKGMVGGVPTYVQSVGISGAVTTYFNESFYFANLVEYACDLFYTFVASDEERHSIDVHLRNGGYLGAVKGDDIAIITPMASFVIECLTALGQTVNTSKTFSDGDFRESCGGNFVDGFDVTPVYFPRRPVEATAIGGKPVILDHDYKSHWEGNNVTVTTSLATLVAAHNALRAWPLAQSILYTAIMEFKSPLVHLTCSADVEEIGLRTDISDHFVVKTRRVPYEENEKTVIPSSVTRQEPYYMTTTERVKVKVMDSDHWVTKEVQKQIKAYRPVTELRFDKPAGYCVVGKTLKHITAKHLVGPIRHKVEVVEWEEYTPTMADFEERVYSGPDEAAEVRVAGDDAFTDTVLYAAYLASGPQYEDALSELLGVSSRRTCK